MSSPDQVVVILDVDAKISHSDLEAQLPPCQGNRQWLQLSDVDMLPIPNRQQQPDAPLDWPGLGAAIQRLIDKLPRPRADRAIEYHIAARSPLPLWTQLAMSMSSWQGTQIIHNPDKHEIWHRLTLGLGGADPAAMGPFFSRVSRPLPDDQEPNATTGWVALAISTKGGKFDRQPIKEALGSELGAIEELSTTEESKITESSALNASAQIESAISLLRNKYPEAAGIALFCVGPGQLAFLVGRLLNPKAINRGKLRVYHYESQAKRYVFALALPWQPPLLEFDKSDAAQRIRSDVLADMREGLETLQRSLKLEHLSNHLSSNAQEAYLKRLQSLQIDRDPVGEEFRLHVISDRITFGLGLLDGIREFNAESRQCFAQLFLLHELFHGAQNLFPSSAEGAGRAGVVLEELDYQADAFSFATLVRWQLELGARRAKNPARDFLRNYLSTALRGLQAFDRLAGNASIERLRERRLRRYLIWHLQYARAQTVRKIDDVDRLLNDRVVVEVAPLRGCFDEKYDKVVLPEKNDEPELFIACGGHFVRKARSGSLRPIELVHAVRDFHAEKLEEAMVAVVTEHQRELTPWYG